MRGTGRRVMSRVGLTMLLGLMLACDPRPGWAEDDGDLAKKTQNPVADLISVPFQNNVNFGVGPQDDVQYILNVQPVIPFRLSEDWNLISRTIVPLIYQPELAPGVGEVFGLGDIQQSLFFSPAKPGKLIWGVGPIFQFPSATDDSLGQGKWGAGPTAVALTVHGPWVLGALINNVWSFAGDSDRRDVNQMLIQPFVNYNLPDAWYLDLGAHHHGGLGSGERPAVDRAHRGRRGQDRAAGEAARERAGQRLLQRGTPGQRGGVAAPDPDPAALPAVAMAGAR